MPLHNPETNKAEIIVGYALSGLFSLMLVFSAIMKFLRDDFLVDSMQAIQLLPAMTTIAIIEFLVILIYWIPKTMNLGFFLCCCYVGGIITGELVGLGGIGLPIPGIPLVAMLFAGTFLRKRSLFFG